MPLLDRRHLLTVLGAGLVTAPFLTIPARRAFAAGDFQQRLAAAEQSGKVSGLDALLVSQRGALLFEHYGKGVNEDISRNSGDTVTFGPEVLHDLRSVSKSVVGLVYGIALAQGKVPSPEAKLYEQFAEYADLARQPGRDKITIAHVLSMTMGLEWDELTVPYGSDLRNSEIAMEAAPDRFRFILGLPIVGEPGVKWTYCGAATAILGRLIAKGTGEKLPAYARRVLFDPMGFGPSEWAISTDGEPRAASGCRRRLAGHANRARRLGEAHHHARRPHRGAAQLRLSLVHLRHRGRRPSAVLVRRHRLGRPETLRLPRPRPRRGDELRQLPQARHRAEPRQRRGPGRGGVPEPGVS